MTQLLGQAFWACLSPEHKGFSMSVKQLPNVSFIECLWADPFHSQQDSHAGLRGFPYHNLHLVQNGITEELYVPKSRFMFRNKKLNNLRNTDFECLHRQTAVLYCDQNTGMPHCPSGVSRGRHPPGLLASIAVPLALSPTAAAAYMVMLL